MKRSLCLLRTHFAVLSFFKLYQNTTYTSTLPPESEIQWLLNECSKYLAQAGDGGAGLEVRRTDVLSAWQGFRPLASDPNAEAGAPVSRDHVISQNPETGITFITGGKVCVNFFNTCIIFSVQKLH